MEIEPAKPQDEAAIKKLLNDCGLPSADIRPEQLNHFFLYRTGKKIIGVVGLELYRDTALLRSLAVGAGHRGQGLAGALIQKAEKYARASGVEKLYLLTTTAEMFFTKRGFQKIPRPNAPQSLQQTTEFSNICPLSSVCLAKHLKPKP